MTVKFIELTKDILIPEVAGRFTKLLEGVHGVLIDDETVSKIQKITEEQREYYLDRSEFARIKDQYLALVAGYFLELHPHDFKFLNRVSNCCVGEIIYAGA